MDPLPGMVVVKTFPARFDADLAVAMLFDAGIEGVVLADPAHAVAPHHMTDRRFRVAVRVEAADDAVVLLNEGHTDRKEADALDELYHQRRFSDRPTWVRRATIVVLVALAGPLVVVATVELTWLVRSAFP